jgi:hypothetical protein
MLSPHIITTLLEIIIGNQKQRLSKQSNIHVINTNHPHNQTQSKESKKVKETHGAEQCK